MGCITGIVSAVWTVGRALNRESSLCGKERPTALKTTRGGRGRFVGSVGGESRESVDRCWLWALVRVRVQVLQKRHLRLVTIRLLQPMSPVILAPHQQPEQEQQQHPALASTPPVSHASIVLPPPYPLREHSSSSAVPSNWTTSGRRTTGDASVKRTHWLCFVKRKSSSRRRHSRRAC